MLIINKWGSWYNDCCWMYGRSKLFVDKKLIVDNDGRHGLGKKCSATDLEAGQHSLRIEFFRADGQAYITATYRFRSQGHHAARPILTMSLFVATVDPTPGTSWSRCAAWMIPRRMTRGHRNGPCESTARRRL